MIQDTAIVTMEGEFGNRESLSNGTLSAPNLDFQVTILFNIKSLINGTR